MATNTPATKTAAKKAPAAKKVPARKPASKPKEAVPGTSHELHPVEIAGQTYMLRNPKGYAGILIANRFQTIEQTPEDEFDTGFMLDSIDLLIEAIFPKGDRAGIRARLSDADDELDMPDLMDAFTRLSELATANPTT